LLISQHALNSDDILTDGKAVYQSSSEVSNAKACETADDCAVPNYMHILHNTVNKHKSKSLKEATDIL